MLALAAKTWLRFVPSFRVASLVGVLLLAAATAAWTGAADSLGSAFDFFSKRDSWGAHNIEQRGLFEPVSRPGSAAIGYRNLRLTSLDLNLG